MNEFGRKWKWGRFVSADWLLVATPGLIWGSSFLFMAEGLKATGTQRHCFLPAVHWMGDAGVVPRRTQTR